MDLDLIATKLEEFNGILTQLGLLPLALVNPKDILPQEKNAHYFTPEKFKQLVANIKKYGRLSSIPLVYRDNEKFRLIDGAHRVEAAKEAGLENILVFIEAPETKDEIISKQLSYNALVGKDDPVVLAELFNSIDDLNLRLETGLENELTNIDYSAINISLAQSKEILFFFLPDDYEEVQAKLDEILHASCMKPAYDVSIAPLAVYEKFIVLLQKTKKAKNIKNNAIALSAVIDFAYNNMKQFMETE